MKKNGIKALSVISVGILMLSSISLSASADSSPDPTLFGFNTDKTALYTSMGFTETQIQNIETASMIPNRFFAYFYYPSYIILPDENYFALGILVPNAYSITSSDVVRGIGVSASTNPVYANTYWYNADGIHKNYLTYNFFTQTDSSFPIISRIKLKTNDVSFMLPATNTNINGVLAPLTAGTVEAGNITKYITGSTDTDSQLTEADAQRLLLHAAYEMSGLDDPNWTYEATVAGDLNFDNQITAADSQILLNALANGTDLW